MTVQRIICGGDFWEMRETLRSRAGYAPHVHDTFSVGQILAGQSECLVAGITHALGAGHCVWIRAGEVHACNPGPDGLWSYRMLHVDEKAEKGQVVFCHFFQEIEGSTSSFGDFRIVRN